MKRKLRKKCGSQRRHSLPIQAQQIGKSMNEKRQTMHILQEFPQDIISFIEHPKLLNDRDLSEWQKTILKSLYCLPLSEREYEIFREGTGRESYFEKEQSELSLIAGRRSGKTTKVAAPVAIFEAFRDHGIPPGENAYVLLIAPQLAQARIAFRSICNYILSSPILSQFVGKVTKDEIHLANNVTIACHPCSQVSVRGYTLIAVVCDELAFFRQEDSYANPEQEIIDALRPGMATAKYSKLIKISTPFRKSGILWNDAQRRSELDFPVWQVPTSVMNPAVSSTVLEREKRRDPRKYQREYEAQFTETVCSWISPEVLERVIVRGRRDLGKMSDNYYVAAIDPGFRQSDFAIAVAHKFVNTIVIDRVSWWRGNKTAPLAFGRVCQEIKTILDEYEINLVKTDQFYSEAIREKLQELGIFCNIVHFGSDTRGKIFTNLRHLIEQGNIELPDDSELLSQLRSLEEIKTERGSIDIRPTSGMKDDLAVVVALAAYDAMASQMTVLEPQLGIVEFSSTGFNPYDCQYAAICRNFPTCQDDGHCYGFADDRFRR
jgi:hypothetical protein